MILIQSLQQKKLMMPQSGNLQTSWAQRFACNCDAGFNNSRLGYDEQAVRALIGASLSEPHTSVTSLRMRVCIYLCLDRPLTGNFK